MSTVVRAFGVAVVAWTELLVQSLLFGRAVSDSVVCDLSFSNFGLGTVLWAMPCGHLCSGTGVWALWVVGLVPGL